MPRSMRKCGIGVLAADTNVVVRLLMDDDTAQNENVLQLFDRETIFLAKTVILETEWVLRSIYRLEPARFAGAIEAVVGLPNVWCEGETEIRQALVWHQEGLDFADALHLASSRQATRFVTFDRDMIKAARRLRLPVSAP
jgi:predicted nucleic-acid-binding protein